MISLPTTTNFWQSNKTWTVTKVQGGVFENHIRECVVLVCNFHVDGTESANFSKVFTEKRLEVENHL